MEDSNDSGLARHNSKQINEYTDVESPPTEPALVRWNKPRINIYRYLAANFSFIIMGMNDAAYGVSLISMPMNVLANKIPGFDSICEQALSECLHTSC